MGVTEAGEDILGIPPSNVAITLARRKVPYQTLTVGKREMRVYLREDVERVKQERDEKKSKSKVKS